MLDIFVSPKSKIGKKVNIGPHSIILGSSIIGDETIIDTGVIVGYPIKRTLLLLREKKDKAFLELLNSVSAGAVIGAGAIIRKGTIIYEKTEIGKNLETGHNVLIREETLIGDNVKIGTGTIIDGKTAIGNNVNIQSNVYIPLLTTIEDNVFIGPGAIILNDKYPPSRRLDGVHIEKNAVIGGGAVLLPGIKIGKNAVIGAGSIVTKDIPSNAVVVGNPAKQVTTREIFDIKKREYEEQI